MRKALIFLLVLIVCLAMAACGGDTTGTDDSSAPAEAAETAEAEEAAEVSDAAETTESVEPQPEESGELSLEGQSLLIYCGAGMQKPFQEIADAFQAETGCKMNVTYANAAQIQTQITESNQGAFFIAGSQEEVKPVSDFVLDSTPLVKHIPVLAVAEGNPKGISGVTDLGSSDIVTVIGDPESTPIGKIAMKAFDDFGVKDSVNLAATTTTAPQLATVISLGEADAAIIWKENCDADGVEICSTPDMDAYVKVIPAARLSFEGESEAATAFLDFLGGDTATAVWQNYGYELAN
ncbi:MAG: molybdate ABC transporter substrate-binding protein [Oscillospiraceae bacterium]|nr:molybdate ABC transporter substrate-binding protein [Oscillospiraceae bacterium]